MDTKLIYPMDEIDELWRPDFVGKPIYHTSNPIEFWTSGISGSDGRGYWNIDNEKGNGIKNSL